MTDDGGGSDCVQIVSIHRSGAPRAGVESKVMCDLETACQKPLAAAQARFFAPGSIQRAGCVPLERVRQDFIAHLTMPKFVSKILAGEIDLPVVRMEKSQKSWRGVHVGDLASYIDRRRAAAIRERDQLCSLT